MFNLHLSYKSTSSWRTLFWPGVRPRKVSRLKKFRALVVPSRGFHKGISIQVIMKPTGVLPNGQSCLRKKGDVMGASINEPINRISTYGHMFRWYIYNTRWPEHPHPPICWYQWLPQGSASPQSSQVVVRLFDNLLISSLNYLLYLAFRPSTKYFPWTGAPIALYMLIFNSKNNYHQVKLWYTYILICTTIFYLPESSLFFKMTYSCIFLKDSSYVNLCQVHPSCVTRKMHVNSYNESIQCRYWILHRLVSYTQ